ncbi:uncharacterized protein A4U43_C01F14480 [Asparagus officinalis]|uniref:Uncharacterized protein n=1 Tax=Asparagus officinalis TaxID=4686 RepID=A0A5P1FPB5_ASPOF|nr:S-type anion channel SLAH3-like [Asparagus officinalis]XP_020245091.1 S-type anion channel SLAH3-like [Asparagus officinalis]XP_020245097.1 S-type anion channel SLAH3-like [Asparagus officinalis]XP_020245100.1 S-type anion channel SLAH3-like [Asparagus officinalis]XP_020245104.1 S-type anion channel SLAH3-like [Asparagus officinalis]ONK80155.1 uncharacterized protein A4U43_C01F14480 [Asparagus officinalis]
MESNNERGSPEQLPTLFKQISSEVVFGFDTIPSPRPDSAVDVSEAASIKNEANDTITIPPISPFQSSDHGRNHSISISMPSSPTSLNIEETKSKSVRLLEGPVINGNVEQPSTYSSPLPPKKSRFYSQPMQSGLSQTNTVAVDKNQYTPRTILRSNAMKDKRFDSFKTWSGKLERQISTLRGKPLTPDAAETSEITQAEDLPAVHRYFDALEGPELETLKSSEELVLPGDKTWPFLLRFPISSFGMCLGVSSQAILWKNLATSPSMKFLHVSLDVNLVLWCVATALICVIASIYALKIIFYFEAVRREYYHPVRVNFFFAPWITCLFLVIGVPPKVAVNLHSAVWYVLMAPIFILELKIYGQWMSGGQRRLSKVANPTNHLSIVGNFVGALLGATMGLKEGPIFFYAVGLAHYAVLFVTLYQRLPTNETLPKELHPVFFLFVAAPSVASMAWAKISGGFAYGSRIAYFIALFLYFSLAVRINFFRGFK